MVVKNLSQGRSFTRAKEILEEYDYRPENLIAILQKVQHEYRYLPEDILLYIATALDIPPASVYGVSTFYSQFSSRPKGRHTLNICDGTACHISSSEEIMDAIRDEAGIKDGETTSEDMLFTVGRVACVGACGLAPVVVVNDDEIHGNMTPEKARRLVASLRETPEPAREASTSQLQVETADSELALTNRDDFSETSARCAQALSAQKMRLLVCMETACLASGAEVIYNRLAQRIKDDGLDIELTPHACSGEHAQKVSTVRAGCHGLCQAGPLIKIEPGNILYVNVSPDDVEEIVETTVKQGEIIEHLLAEIPESGERVQTEGENPFYRQQEKIALKTCGTIDTENIYESLGTGGYSAAVKALFEMTPEEVIAEVQSSGLRGRGGAGFPTALKWEFTAREESDIKYVVCNGDEGDPGAFMDRCIMEGDPHRLLEGMMIAGYAIGAETGIIYVRAEYPLAVKRLRRAISQATKLGLLGRNILGTDFSFTIKIKEGAGAFVCGEETSLLSSLQGQRGIPRPRPPFPAQSGLWEHPTLINNVETLTNIPFIIGEGADTFSRLGHDQSAGTKTFALAGHVARTGLVEVPFGLTLRELIFDIGGGMKGDARFKAVQIGGPSGGCLPASELDRRLDYESIQEAGAIIGSGGLIVMDENTCMVEVARFFMSFIQDESCGKCVPCREGTKQMLNLLEKIAEGQAEENDLELLENLAENVNRGAMCGLGQTAPNPILSSLRYFRDEYEAHIHEKRCPAGHCRSLKKLRVLADECINCGQCAKVCPHGAITEKELTDAVSEAMGGEEQTAHFIDENRCNGCEACLNACPLDAIIRV